MTAGFISDSLCIPNFTIMKTLIVRDFFSSMYCCQGGSIGWEILSQVRCLLFSNRTIGKSRVHCIFRFRNHPICLHSKCSCKTALRGVTLPPVFYCMHSDVFLFLFYIRLFSFYFLENIESAFFFSYGKLN